MDLKKIILFAIGPIFGAILGFISLPITTWFFSPEDIGRISLLFVILSLSTLTYSIGLDQYYVREFHESDNKERLFKETFLPGLLLLSISLFIFLLVDDKYLSSTIFGLNSNYLSIMLTVLILISYIIRFLSLILRMNEMALKFSLSQILGKISFLFILIIFVSINDNQSFNELITFHVMSYMIVLSYLILLTYKTLICSFKEKINYSSILSAVKFGYPLIFGGIAFWGLTAIDRLFLKNYSTLNELAIYSVASSFAGAAVIVQSIFSTIWAPLIYKLSANNENLYIIDDVRNVMLLLVTIIFSLAGCLSWLILYLLPSEYSDVQFLVVTCMGYPLLYTLSETTVIGINLSKKTHYSMLASLLAFICNIVGNYILIPKFGAVGASISTCFSFYVFFILRTEFSSYLWLKIPRFKLYIIVSSLCFLSILTALLGDDFSFYIRCFWLVVFLSTFVIFKDGFKFIFNIINNRK